MGVLVIFIGMYLVMQLGEKRVSMIGVPVYKHIQQFKAVQEKKTTFALAIKNMVMIHVLQAVLLFVAVLFATEAPSSESDLPDWDLTGWDHL